MADEPKQIPVEDAHKEGVYGTIHDPIENDAYTVQGQGEETAQREREAGDTLRARFKQGSQEQAPAKKSSSSKSSPSSSSGSSSS